MSRYLIHADVKVTRRKTLCTVFDPAGEQVSVHRKLMQCLVWLHENEVEECDIDNGLHRYRVRIAPILEQSRPWTGADETL